MESRTRKAVLGMLGIAMAAAMTTGCAGGKEFPAKEITVVVPWNPGGTNDLMARALQPVFKDKFGVELVVKNSAGGGSAVGITEVLTSKADGYTVGLASSSFLASSFSRFLLSASISCFLISRPPYRPSTSSYST